MTVEERAYERAAGWKQHFDLARRAERAEAEIERLRAALTECAKGSYLDQHDLVFLPTREAKIARAALTHQPAVKEKP